MPAMAHSRERTRNLEYGSYAFAGAALLAAIAIAVAVAYGIQFRSYFALLMAIAGGICAVIAAWRLWAGDTTFFTGVLAYSAMFCIGFGAVIDLVTPAALSLIFNEVCGGRSCSSAGFLTAREQSGYTLAGIAAIIGLVPALAGVFFLGAERARRRR
jgi:hypothetical protein